MSRFAHQQNIDTDAATLQLGEDFKKSHCLLHSEVLLLLEDLQERRREEALTLPLPPPSKVFVDTMEYVKTFGLNSNRELVKAIRQTMMSEAKLREFEMAQLGNLAPSTAEEAKTLIPSLQGHIDDEALQRILDDIATTRRYNY